MRPGPALVLCTVGIALLLISFPSMAVEPEVAAASQIAVTSVIMDPAVFFEGDTGIITLEITNNGPESVAIRRATMYDNDLSVISSSYDTTTTVGPANKMQFTFTVKADLPP